MKLYFFLFQTSNKFFNQSINVCDERKRAKETRDEKENKKNDIGSEEGNVGLYERCHCESVCACVRETCFFHCRNTVPSCRTVVVSDSCRVETLAYFFSKKGAVETAAPKSRDP